MSNASIASPPVARRITLSSSSSDASPAILASTPAALQVASSTPLPNPAPPSVPLPLPVRAPSSTPISIPPPVRNFAFQPLSDHDWVQAKKRYTGESPPPPVPVRYSAELQASAEIASWLELSPQVSPAASVASSAMEALFEDSDTFEVMII